MVFGRILPHMDHSHALRGRHNDEKETEWGKNVLGIDCRKRLLDMTYICWQKVIHLSKVINICGGVVARYMVPPQASSRMDPCSNAPVIIARCSTKAHSGQLLDAFGK